MMQFTLTFLALFLVLLNGFFVAAEFALVKLRNTRVQAIRAVYGLRGEILARVHTQLDAYLSACQLGITLASLGLGWVGEPAFATLIEPLLHRLGIFSPTALSGIAFACAFFLISFLHIVVGELAPKTLAIRQPQKISLWTAIPLYCFYWLMYPFIWLLNKSANLMLKFMGRAAHHEAESAYYSSEELKLILHGSHSHGEIEKEEAEILDNALDFADLKVADIMRPAEEMIALSLRSTLPDNLNTMRLHRYSRYPLYETDPHQIVGIVHVKDIFFNAVPEQSLQNQIRPVLTVTTDLPALNLFRKFRAGLTHFAMVKHRGTLVGFVTLTDILNALLGQIRDEFSKHIPDWISTKDGALLMKGNSPLYLLEKALNITLPEMEANTISGLLLSTLERLPKQHEQISFELFDIEVLKIKGPKILLVKVFSRPTTTNISTRTL